ncbi:GTPase IMAP family member 8-like, partial [Engraulis encrasicolus]|uniref:GTPase IMAP family member 8-like n=1 Tax=Engraulis encrasicolus TaxID=184585 RepID=UPI002FCE8943
MAAAQTPTCPITLVLLGEFGTGKSASGNTILGEKAFASRASAAPLTTQCQKAEREVYGRRVTVIDTPDFFDQDLKQSDRHVRECREMCKGRECVYLLVIQIGRFTEGERGILERLEKRLGKIRDRTMILFTYGDGLKGQSIDDYVRNTNPHLQQLIGKCGDRYQVFNNKDRGEWRGQVETLMEQIYKGNVTQSPNCPITLVLLGEFGTGKSASGNTILGDDKFASKATVGPLTTQCQKAERNVCGRRVTVIDTPDFFDKYLKEPERHVRECRTMCKGRECVYLLVIQIGRFTEGERDILERLERKLGRIRDRTIILFTHGDALKSRQSIDDYVGNTNKDLQKLISECGGRYEVFNSKSRDEWRGQVERLMEKIYKGNVSENKRRGKEQREGSVVGPIPDTSRPRRPAQSPNCPITLVLLGEFGSGKSASGNTILGEEKFASEATASPLTTQCQKAEGDVYGRWMTVIDTPDFFDQDLKQSDRHVKECREMCKGRECVYLLVIQIGRFTEGERDILERLEKKLGKIRDRTIILFTYGDDLKYGQSIDDYVRNTNLHLQKLIGKCGNRYHVLNNRASDEQVKEQQGANRRISVIAIIHTYMFTMRLRALTS